MACEHGSLMPDMRPSSRRLVAAHAANGAARRFSPARPKPAMKTACKRSVRCRMTNGSTFRMSHGASCDETPKAIGWHAKTSPMTSVETPRCAASKGKKGASIHSRNSDAKPSTIERRRTRHLVRLKYSQSSAASCSSSGVAGADGSGVDGAGAGAAPLAAAVGWPRLQTRLPKAKSQTNRATPRPMMTKSGSYEIVYVRWRASGPAVPFNAEPCGSNGNCSP